MEPGWNAVANASRQSEVSLRGLQADNQQLAVSATYFNGGLFNEQVHLVPTV
jgi:hypothetical protein